MSLEIINRCSFYWISSSLVFFSLPFFSLKPHRFSNGGEHTAQKETREWEKRKVEVGAVQRGEWNGLTRMMGVKRRKWEVFLLIQHNLPSSIFSTTSKLPPLVCICSAVFCYPHWNGEEILETFLFYIENLTFAWCRRPSECSITREELL